jgi:aminopeptidase N
LLAKKRSEHLDQVARHVLMPRVMSAPWIEQHLESRPRTRRSVGGSIVALALALGGCSAEELGASEDAFEEIQPSANPGRDVVSTRLDVDLETLEAVAVVDLAAADAVGATLEVGDLEIADVVGPEGPVNHRVTDGVMDLGVPASEQVSLEIHYRLHTQSKMEGLTESGATFLWPYFCGNLFPCKSDPSDGLRFDVTLSGVPDGQRALFPATIPADAPSYMVAWVVGEYEQLDLGTTSAGTHVSAYYLPGELSTTVRGTEHLTAAFDWLEQTYGEYIFGSEVGSVSAHWGPGAYGGMEHHPLWHVSAGSMGDEETHVHEAAHGWFGDGVRIGCWEDLTLSEGTTSYVTARAIGAVAGEAAELAVWQDYEQRLDSVIRRDDRIAWPETCGEIDVLHDLWNGVVYMKGAFFYRAVEHEVGREAIDRSLAEFYAQYRGESATMGDMLATIESVTGFDASELAQGWLRSMGRPDR